MLTVPAATAVTVPEASTEATEASEVDQLPPLPDTDNAMLPPSQTEVVALEIVPAEAEGSTVSADVAVTEPQPLAIVYEIVAEPAAIAVTVPVLLTVAIVASLMDHVPPDTEDVAVPVVPGHIVAGAVIVPAVEGATSIVILCVALLVPHVFVFV
jgi:hypothetical protein